MNTRNNDAQTTLNNEEKYRLTAKYVNDLIYSFIDNESKRSNVRVSMHVMQVVSDSSSNQPVYYFIVEKNIIENNQSIIKKFVYFPVSKDSHTKHNEVMLPCIEDLIRAFVRIHKDYAEYNMVLPMRECRGIAYAPIKKPYFSSIFDLLQKQHIVLVTINFSEQKIIKHDSQHDFNPLVKKTASLFWLHRIYPDTISASVLTYLKSINCNFTYEERFYGSQGDNLLCGYYVSEFMKSLLSRGDDTDFKHVKFTTASEQKNQMDIADRFVISDRISFMKAAIPAWNIDDYYMKILNKYNPTPHNNDMRPRTFFTKSNSYPLFSFEKAKKEEVNNEFRVQRRSSLG